MTIEHHTVRTKCQHSVVKRAAAGAAGHSFMHADVENDVVPSCRLTECSGEGSGHDDAILHQPREDSLDRRVIPQRDIATAIEPRGITRKPRLREDDEPGAKRCSFA